MTEDAVEKAKLINTVKRLRNVRFSQTGAKAAATQRKLELAVQDAYEAGITDAELR